MDTANEVNFLPKLQQPKFFVFNVVYPDMMSGMKK